MSEPDEQQDLAGAAGAGGPQELPGPHPDPEPGEDAEPAGAPTRPPADS